ncbi:MAG: DUF2141 domain-containing protein [Acidobacteria bacterium]|nr:DUF2141 domain-containing protein [Acidobacteriota bacterium]
MASALVVPVQASELLVKVSNIPASSGEIGCALFSAAPGFPTDPSRAKVLWQPAQRGSLVCRFEGIAAGRYAVSVSHDLNGNRKTDTKMFGIPTEDWGVSNNVRHRLRPPKFEEAAVSVTDGQTLTIDVELGR